MTKAELLKEIAEISGATQVDTKKFYDALEEAMANALSEGDDELRLGFATIRVKHRDAYMGTNPSTQEPMEIPAKNIGRMALSAPMKRAIAQ